MNKVGINGYHVSLCFCFKWTISFIFYTTYLHVFYVGLGCSEHILARVCSIIINILHNLCLNWSISELGDQKCTFSRGLLGLLVTDHLRKIGQLGLGALGTSSLESEGFVSLMLFCLRFGSETQMKACLISIPNCCNIGRILGSLILKFQNWLETIAYGQIKLKIIQIYHWNRRFHVLQHKVCCCLV